MQSKFRRKFSWQQRAKIRQLFDDGYGICYLARKFKCWPNAIWTIVYDLAIPRKATKKEQEHFLKSSKVTIDDVIEIRKLAKQGYGSPFFAKMYGISQTTALNIMNGKTYRWLKGYTKKGFLNPIKIGRIRRKTDKKSGAKPGVKKTVPRGTLITLSKKYHVKPCTICRWISKGKIKVKRINL
jgi:hypothetical protein